MIYYKAFYKNYILKGMNLNKIKSNPGRLTVSKIWWKL